MATKKIIKSKDINAPKEKVWNVLFNNDVNHKWYAEFMEGSIADTDWQVGSKAIFTDGKGNGIVGKIDVHEPNQYLSIVYTGEVKDGKEDYEGEVAKQMTGVHENYRVTESNGTTRLDVDCDMDEGYYDMMNEAWDRAMDKIKSLSEGE